MKLATVDAILDEARNFRDILVAFELLEYDIECDVLECDEIHYMVTTHEGDRIFIRYDFCIGTCYISVDDEADEDKELVLRFSIVSRSIQD